MGQHVLRRPVTRRHKAWFAAGQKSVIQAVVFIFDADRTLCFLKGRCMWGMLLVEFEASQELLCSGLLPVVRNVLSELSYFTRVLGSLAVEQKVKQRRHLMGHDVILSPRCENVSSRLNAHSSTMGRPKHTAVHISHSTRRVKPEGRNTPRGAYLAYTARFNCAWL